MDWLHDILAAMEAQTYTAAPGKERVGGEQRCGCLPQQLRREILRFARQCGIHRVILYGSRARGTNQAHSDIDIAVRGGDTLRFMLEIDDHVRTLLTFDVVDLGGVLTTDLRREIAKDGVILMDSTEQFERALQNLHLVENIEDEMTMNPVVALAASTNLFQICFEQSWRAMKAVLADHGYAEAASGSPRQIIQLAYRVGLVTDEEGWLEMLQARRTSAHVYNEEAARSVQEAVPRFIGLFEKLKTELQHWRLPDAGR
ncbi:MAG: hypothetical protein HDQ87_04570 [Clostridia bacterium]|nr:hypothetical protein [Clostridia bacterium]